jgi:uncharacterized protein (DUF1015 family)
MRIKAFETLRPKAELVSKVAAPPYDVVDADEARALAVGNPFNFLRVSRAEVDFPVGTDPYSPAIYAKAAETFAAFQSDGVLVRDARPSLYLYRQRMGTHVQRGVVACCHVEDYERNLIRKHEKTRQDKEDDRVRHVQALRANSGPVFLMYRDVPAIDRIVAECEYGRPVYDFTAPDGVVHTVWRFAGHEALAKAFAAVPLLYIADGHHRAAAAARAGAEYRKSNPSHTGNEEYNWFLAVMFPATQLQILAYNRLVKDLNGHTPASFLGALKGSFRVTPGAGPKPPSVRRASMFLDGKWCGLEWDLPADADPVKSLDVSYLQERLLDPVLGIRDPRTDKRISFVGGGRGTKELEDRVRRGDAAVAFSMYPVTPDQVMDIADAGQIMPPKSTWFEPKLRSGLLIHTL